MRVRSVFFGLFLSLCAAAVAYAHGPGEGVPVTRVPTPLAPDMWGALDVINPGPVPVTLQVEGADGVHYDWGVVSVGPYSWTRVIHPMSSLTVHSVVITAYGPPQPPYGVRPIVCRTQTHMERGHVHVLNIGLCTVN